MQNDQPTEKAAAGQNIRSNQDAQGNLTTHGFRVCLRFGKFAWPGGYPCYFVTSDGAALSFEAAKENAKAIIYSIRHQQSDGWRVLCTEVNWEDPELFCDHTGKRIESAYAEDRAEGIAYFERFQIRMGIEDAKSASHQGQCDDDVAALVRQPNIATQLDAIGGEAISAELKEYGAWDAEELADHDQNRARIVWQAACNIREEQNAL